MTTRTKLWRKLLGFAAALWASSMAAQPTVSNAEPLVLSPFQVLAQSLELKAYCSTQGDKQLLRYLRVANVAKGSHAESAGLKVGDRIVAIAGWRLEGQELAALNRNFPTPLRDGIPSLSLTVHRPYFGKEHEVFLPFPRKEPGKKEPDRPPSPTRKS